MVLSGDAHVGYAFDVKEVFGDPASRTLGTEFVTTSTHDGRVLRDRGGPSGTRTRVKPVPGGSGAARDPVPCSAEETIVCTSFVLIAAKPTDSTPFHRRTRGDILMVHRSAGAGCAALAVLGTLVLTGPPAAGAADPPVPTTATSAAETLGAHKPSAEVLRALRRDLGLNETQARTRLVNEAEAGTRAGRLQNALGASFAGAWLRGATSANLTVATTDVGDIPLIEAGGANAVLAEHGLD